MRRSLLMLFALALATSAAAQAYKWVDKDGKVRYGDTPPPGVKATPLKGPARPPTPSASASEAKKDDAKKDAAAKDTKPLTPEAAFQKRQKERQEAEEKAAKERADAAAKKENCDLAQGTLRQLQSGQRMSSVNAAGERVFIDDDQRQQQIQQAQRSVAEWCK